MTKGELRHNPESSLQDLRSLIIAVLGLPDDFSGDAKISFASTSGNAWPDFEALCEDIIYFFDIAPMNSKAKVKLYLTTRKNGPMI